MFHGGEGAAFTTLLIMSSEGGWTRRGLFWGAGLAAVAASAAAGAETTQYDATATVRANGDAASHLDRGDATTVKVIWRAKTTEKVLALTFDDGPGERLTRPLLDVLREEKVRASFGVVGSRAAKMRDVIARDVSDGHDLINHSWSHPDLCLMDINGITRELERTDQLLYELTGSRPTMVRPPFGRVNGALLQHVAASHQSLLMWQMRFAEDIYDSAGLAAHVLDSLEPGLIVLGHDVGSRRRDIGIGAVPAIIKGARERGYRFVTATEMLELDAAST